MHTVQEILTGLQDGSHVLADSHVFELEGGKHAVTLITAPEAVPPTVTSASIGVSGQVGKVQFSEPVKRTDGTPGDGFTWTSSNSVAINATFDSGDETDELTYLFDRVVAGSETITLTYASSGGMVMDLNNNPLGDATITV